MSKDDELAEAMKRGFEKVAQRFVANAAGDVLDTKAINNAIDEIDDVQYRTLFGDSKSFNPAGLDVSGKEVAKAYPRLYQNAPTKTPSTSSFSYIGDPNQGMAEDLSKMFGRDTDTADRQARSFLKTLGTGELDSIPASNSLGVEPNVFGPKNVSMWQMSETVPTTTPRPNQ